MLTRRSSLVIILAAVLASMVAAVLLMLEPANITVPQTAPATVGRRVDHGGDGSPNNRLEMEPLERRLVRRETEGAWPSQTLDLRGTLLDSSLRPVAGCGYALMRIGADTIEPTAYTGDDGSWTLSVPGGKYPGRSLSVEFFVAANLRATCTPKVNPCVVALPPMADIDVAVLGLPPDAAWTYSVQPTDASQDGTTKDPKIFAEVTRSFSTDAYELAVVVKTKTDVVHMSGSKATARVLAGDMYAAYVQVVGREVDKPLRIDMAPFTHQVTIGARSGGLHVAILDQSGSIANVDGSLKVVQGDRSSATVVLRGRGVCDLPGGTGDVRVAFRAVDGRIILGHLDEASVVRQEVCILYVRDAIVPTVIEVKECAAIAVERSDGNWSICRRNFTGRLGEMLWEADGKLVASIPDARWARGFAILESGAVVEIASDPEGRLKYNTRDSAKRHFVLPEEWPEIEAGDKVYWVLECQLLLSGVASEWIALRVGETEVRPAKSDSIELDMVPGIVRYRVRASVLRSGVYYPQGERPVQ